MEIDPTARDFSLAGYTKRRKNWGLNSGIDPRGKRGNPRVLRNARPKGRRIFRGVLESGRHIGGILDHMGSILVKYRPKRTHMDLTRIIFFDFSIFSRIPWILGFFVGFGVREASWRHPRHYGIDSGEVSTQTEPYGLDSDHFP